MPLFKYLRISCDLRTILENESVSCIAAHSKVLFLGTAWGKLRALDHEGNINFENKFPEHNFAINQISADEKGEYIGTCSDDGNVHISCLYAEDNSVSLKLDRQIKSIELDPMYCKTKRFILGDRQLTLYDRTFFKGFKPRVLSESEGFVSAIKWNGDFVAWSSSMGVRIYDLNEKCSLGLIKWEEPKEGSLADYKCHLVWSSSSQLLIGWVETIRICVIRKRNVVEVATRNLPGFIVDPISTFQTTEFYICGLGPLEKNQLVVLGLPKLRNEDGSSPRPVFCAIQYRSNEYTELCTDSLTLKG